MLRIRTLGVALVAVFALSAVVASAASALEFTVGTTYGAVGGTTTLKVKELALTVTCESNEVVAGEGEFKKGTKGTVNKIIFHGCKAAGTHACHTETAGAEEIVTNALKTKLVLFAAGAGVEFASEVAGTPLAEFKCAIGTPEQVIAVTGNVTGEITPTETLIETFLIEFNEALGGQNLKASLNGGVAQPATQTAADTITTANMTKIKF